MLAIEEISFRITDEVLHLKPTLRAALRLERRFGGFDKLITAIDEESVTAMATVMRESATSYTTIPDLIEGFAGMTLARSIVALKQPLIDHVLRLAGHDSDDNAPADPGAKRITFADHHQRLFEIATGWLGWTPTDAYEATAAEIMAAFKGKMEMLRACYGGSDAPDTAINAEPTAEQFNAKLLAFVNSKSKVAA